MFKLDLEKAEEPEIQLPTSFGSLKKLWKSRKISTSALLMVSKLLTLWITTHWKILQEIGIPDHFTCLLRHLYAGQEATVRIGHGTTDWLKIGKGVHQGYILSPCLFNLYAEYIMRNAGLDEAQTGIKIAGRNINNFRSLDDAPLRGRKQRRTKDPLEESERGEWKSWFKTQHSKTENHGILPITSWQIDGETMETVRYLIFWSPKSLQIVTAGMALKDACSLEEKLWLT